MSASYILLKENNEKQMSLNETNSTSMTVEHTATAVNKSQEHLDLFHTMVFIALLLLIYVCFKKLVCSLKTETSSSSSLSCSNEAVKERL